MGESKPACGSKQVLHAFEDAYLLGAKVGFGRGDVRAIGQAFTFKRLKQSNSLDLRPVLIQNVLPGVRLMQSQKFLKGNR